MTNITNELTCKEFVELVTAYLEGVLAPEGMRQVSEHLRECEGCETYLRQIQQTIGVLRTLADSPTVPTNKQELLELFRSRITV